MTVFPWPEISGSLQDNHPPTPPKHKTDLLDWQVDRFWRLRSQAEVNRCFSIRYIESKWNDPQLFTEFEIHIGPFIFNQDWKFLAKYLPELASAKYSTGVFYKFRKSTLSRSMKLITSVFFILHSWISLTSQEIATVTDQKGQFIWKRVFR